MALGSSKTSKSSSPKKNWSYTINRHDADHTAPSETVIDLTPSDGVAQKARFLMEAHLAVNKALPTKLYVLHEGVQYVVRIKLDRKGDSYHWTIERPVQIITGGSVIAPPEVRDRLNTPHSNTVSTYPEAPVSVSYDPINDPIDPIDRK